MTFFSYVYAKNKTAKEQKVQLVICYSFARFTYFALVRTSLKRNLIELKSPFDAIDNGNIVYFLLFVRIIYVNVDSIK